MNFMEMVNIIFPYTRARAVPQPLAAATADRKQYGDTDGYGGNSITHVRDVTVFYNKAGRDRYSCVMLSVSSDPGEFRNYIYVAPRFTLFKCLLLSTRRLYAT